MIHGPDRRYELRHQHGARGEETEIRASQGIPGKTRQEQFFMPFTVAGELACGRSAADKRTWKRLCSPFALIPWTPDILWQYGELYRHLQAGGNLIGTNDLWIAATALVHGMPLVTNNADEFRRVPGLVVLEY
jgi:predicted nucleic acid-binding protein